MYKGKFLALALAASTAFSMLAPNTGFLIARAEEDPNPQLPIEFDNVSGDDGKETGAYDYEWFNYSVSSEAGKFQNNTTSGASISVGATGCNDVLTVDVSTGSSVGIGVVTGRFITVEATGENEMVSIGDAVVRLDNPNESDKTVFSGLTPISNTAARLNKSGKVVFQVDVAANPYEEERSTDVVITVAGNEKSESFTVTYVQEGLPHQENEGSSGDSKEVTTPAAITGIKVSAEDNVTSISADTIVKLTAEPIIENGTEAEKAELIRLFNMGLQWSSSDESVASCRERADVSDAPGTKTITGTGAGEAVIRAQYTGDDGIITGEYKLTVIDNNRRSGGGSGGSGGSTSRSVTGTSTVKSTTNADGSVTKTTTTANGTIQSTTKTNEDGSSQTKEVVTNKDGSGSVKEVTVSATGTTKSVEVITDTTGAVAEVKTSIANSSGVSMDVSYKVSGTKLTLSKVETEGKTKVSIPATVTCDGKTFKVTKLAAGVLSNNSTIKTVTLGKNISVIGKNAFKGSSKLKTVTLKNAPSKVGKNAFKGINKNATIKIKASAKAFKAAKKLIKKSGVASTVKFKRVK